MDIRIFIEQELNAWQISTDRVNRMLDRMEADLQDYKKKDKPNAIYIRKTEGSIALLDEHNRRMEALVDAMHAAVHKQMIFRDCNAENTHLRRKIEKLENILTIQYGFDMSLLPFYKKPDFRSYPFST